MKARVWPIFALLGLLGVVSQLAGCDAKVPYQKKDGQWFYESKPLSVPASTPLTPLNPRFARAGAQVFYRHAAIAGADSATFVVLDAQHGKDKSSAFFCDTYRESKDYFLTRNVLIERITGADATSFRVLRDGYAVDNTRAYYDGKPFSVRDVASFELLEHGFSRDRQRGYYDRVEIPASDGASFAALDNYYARDKARVYYAFLESQSGTGRLRPTVVSLQSADAGTFASKSDGYAVDAKQVFYKGRVVSSQPASLELLTMSYAKTSSEVFYQGALISGAQAASFKVLQPAEGSADGADSGGKYSQGKRL